MRVVLIACSSQKKEEAAPARELYTSSLFKKALEYARTQTSDDLIFVMSAMHGLVGLGKILTPYDRELSKMRKIDRTFWGIRLVDDLVQRLHARGLTLTKADEVMLLGGEDYNTPVRGALFRKEVPCVEPLKGMNIGQRLHWLGETAADLRIKARAAAREIIMPTPPHEPDVIAPKKPPPVFRPSLPYVKQTSSPLHGWRIEVYDPTVSETEPVKSTTSVKKFTGMQKHQMLQNYKYTKSLKEEDDAESNH